MGAQEYEVSCEKMYILIVSTEHQK